MTRIGRELHCLVGCAVACAIAATGASADAPTVLARGAAGSFDVTILGPAPVVPGETAWIVSLGGAETGADARVAIDADGVRGRGAAPGPVAVHVHRAGRTTVRVEVERGGARGRLAFELDVAPAPGLFSHWRAIAVAPLGLAAFGLHQWRARRGRADGTRA